jgi:hypothetical protein
MMAMATETPPEEIPRPAEKKTEPMIRLGSQSVIGVKIGAAISGVMILLFYLIFLINFDSPFWLLGIILGAIGLVFGIMGVFLGNIKVSKRRKNFPTMNVIFIVLSIILLFAMPVFGSWEDPNTLGSGMKNIAYMAFILAFTIAFLVYIELCHASLRFSDIDDYATSHNLKEFSVGSVITNYAIWASILLVVIFLITLAVLMFHILLSPLIESAAPPLGNSIEYNSIYSILISIGIIFVPIGIILTFIFGTFFKSRRSIVVKGKEDVVARRPDAVKIK